GQMEVVANTLAAEVYKVVQKIQYKDWVDLNARQKEISVGVRKPSKEEIDRAKKIMEAAGGPNMKRLDGSYARETMVIKGCPSVKQTSLQAGQSGDRAVAASPAEVFVEIGLEIKKKSPFQTTFGISLANG